MFVIDDVSAALEIINKLISQYQKNAQQVELNQKIELIMSKIDDVFLRDLRAANKMLNDISTSHDLTSLQLLSKTEDLFLKNIGLNPDLKTGGVQNTYLIALSYLGLFRIGIMQRYNDNILSAYVLRMYETGEHFIRADIFPELYNSYFSKKCSDIVEKHECRKRNLAKPSDYLKAGAVRVGQLGVIVGAALIATGGLAFKVTPTAAAHGAKGLIKSLDEEIPTAEYYISAEQIEKECQREIDLKCAQIAKNLLDSLSVAS